MDDKRRNSLREALRHLSSVSTILGQVSDKERDCVDNYPENLQGTDTYERMERAAEDLEEAIEKIDEAIELIESAAR